MDARVRNALVIIEVVLAVLLMAGVLVQTPKASGLGGTIGGGGGGEPSGELGDAIASAFGGFDQLKQQMSDAGVNRFGSGWSWLVVDGGDLKVTSTANQDSPISDDQTPILGIDVWEHAYYLKYQNLRASYLDAWWNVVNWKAVEAKLAAAKAGK